MTYDYHEPQSVPEALELLAQHGEDAHFVAGATAFTLLWRQGLLRPGHVIGLRRVPALGGITASGGSLAIGATVTHRAIERSHVAEMNAQEPHADKPNTEPARPAAASVPSPSARLAQPLVAPRRERARRTSAAARRRAIDRSSRRGPAGAAAQDPF